MIIKEQIVVGNKTITFEVGRVARQSDGAVLVSLGETVVLVSAVAGPEKKEYIEMGFVPLTVDYREKTYAAGKIPGGFFKREGRPREKEILTSRLIDRSIRPLLPKKWNRETLVQVLVLSSDGENDSNIPAIIGASAALMVSPIPFDGPVGAVTIGCIDDKFIVNPTFEEDKGSTLDMVVAGKRDSIMMVESGSKEISEDAAIRALNLAHEEIKNICAVQERIKEKLSITKHEAPVLTEEDEINAETRSVSDGRMKNISEMRQKADRKKALEELEAEVCEKLKDKFPEKEGLIKKSIEKLFAEELRKQIIEKEVRVDGRRLDEVRPITIEAGFLPRTHGSALFTRGETQSLATVTLGTAGDMQIMDDLEGEYKERFMLHYNFPGFATGEPRADRGPGRREIGHGALAKRALYPVMPPEEEFAYTIRVVSDILESNGSSSMASVCGGSLALFDAGVPVKDAVAGVAMGLVIEGEKYKILTDIMGAEDHFGDMDLKAAGTKNGLTALQMDIKVAGISVNIIKETLQQAREARLFILGKMKETLAQPRSDLSSLAPRIEVVMIPQDKIGALIGPGGKNIRKIIEESQAEIEVDDDGKVFISSTNNESLKKARRMVEMHTAEVEVGKVYKGKVARLVKFGAFVEVLPGKDGLLHISQISKKRVEKVEDVLSEGDEIDVLVYEIDSQGRVNLTCKGVAAALAKK